MATERFPTIDSGGVVSLERDTACSEVPARAAGLLNHLVVDRHIF